MGNDSGDATLAVFDLRQKRLEGRVTNQEDELLSIQIVKVRPKLLLNPWVNIAAVSGGMSPSMKVRVSRRMARAVAYLVA